MEARVQENYSWIMKVIMNLKDRIRQMQAWTDMAQRQKFQMKMMY